jgi:hypothetical protein
MIFRYVGRFYKVIMVRGVGGNDYIFDCKDVGTKKSQTLTLNLSHAR